jgi:hypothetical protein
MTRPSKRQAQIRRLAEAKVRLNRDDVEDTSDLSSKCVKAYPQSATSQTVSQSLAGYPCNVYTN